MRFWKTPVGNKVTKTLALSLAAVLAAGGVDAFWLRESMEAQAAIPLLPGIEQLRSQIVDQGGVYRILEIAPEHRAGDIGTYIGGQEPLPSLWDAEQGRWLNWKDRLAAYRTAEERADFMTGLRAEYDSLTGALGGDFQRVLTWSDYQEVGRENSGESGVSEITIEAGKTRGVFHYSEGGDWNVAFQVADVNVTLEDISGVYTEGENIGKVISVQPYYKLVSAVQLTRKALRELAEKENAGEIHLYHEAGYQAYYTYAGTAEDIWSVKKDEKIVSGGDAGSVSGSDAGGSGGEGGGESGGESGGEGSGETAPDQVEPPEESLTGVYQVQFAFIQPGENLDGINRVYRVNTDYTSYRKGGGDYALTEAQEGEKGEEFVLPGETVWFRGGLLNRELFRKLVWGLEDEESGRFAIEVVTVTPEQLNALAAQNSLAELLKDCQMLHITGGVLKGRMYGTSFGYENVTDMNDWVRDALLQHFVGKELPAAVDGSLAGLGNGGYDSFVLPSRNVARLACGLMLAMESWNPALNVQEVRDSLGNRLDTNHDGSFVNESAWVYRSPDLPLIYSDFAAAEYDQSRVDGGFAVVKAELQNENRLRTIEGAQTGEVHLLSEAIDDGAVWRYIINYSKRRISTVKDTLKVLEIQPATGSAAGVQGVQLNKELVKRWAGNSEVTVISEVMSISEFIGSIEDLNTQYDLIYIGSSMEGFYTRRAGSAWITDFNDDNMDGLLYSHTGDSIRENVYLSGLLDSDFTDPNNPWTLRKTPSLHRFSGNDLTPEKYNALMDYLAAHYPLVVADELITVNGQTRSINRNRVDNSSYLYELLNESLDKSNLFRVSDLAGGSNAEFAYCVNLPKLKLHHNKAGSILPGVAILNGRGSEAEKYAPRGESQELSQVYQLEKINGKYYMQFEFSLENTGAVSYTSDYVCNLYLDYNADGKFNTANEKLTSFVVTENDKVIPADSLKAGVTYRVSREIPGDYYGCITWQIEIVQKSNPMVRVTQKGYSRLKRGTGESARPIRILQVHYNDEKYINLAAELASSSSNFGKAYDKVDEDYDLEVDVVDLYSLDPKKNFNKMTREQVLSYDMLIIGFSDGKKEESIDAWSDDAIENLKAFIGSGKSVLMSHDTTSIINFNFRKYKVDIGGEYFWGYKINTKIRNLVGMDVFGVQTNHNPVMTSLDPPDKVNGRYEYDKKEAAYTPKSGRSTVVEQIQGFTAMMLNSRKNGNWKMYRSGNTGWGNSITTSVDRVNEGQITNYPFTIGETVTIAKTHQQYYTLDMNQDKDRDGQTDMVVWYTLGTTKDYQITAKDVRNNYYIYSTGNIIYTGMGHSVVETPLEPVTLDEAKLFINTMIAAYQAGRKEGEISLYDENLNPTDVFYNYYGSAEGSMTDSFKLVFKLSDLNLASGGKLGQVRFYMESAPGAPGAVPMDLKGLTGQNLWVRPLTTEIYRKDNDAKVENGNALAIDTFYYIKINASELAASVQDGSRARLILGYRSILTGVDNAANDYEAVQWRSSSVSFVNSELFNLD